MVLVGGTVCEVGAFASEARGVATLPVLFGSVFTVKMVSFRPNWVHRLKIQGAPLAFLYLLNRRLQR